MPALPRLQSHLLAGAPCPLWSARRCLLHARKGISMYFNGALEKSPSHSKPSLISLIQRLRDLQYSLHEKSGEVPGCQVKVPRHKSRRPEARAMTLMRHLTTELIRVLHTLFILLGLPARPLALPRAATRAGAGKVSSKGPLGQPQRAADPAEMKHTLAWGSVRSSRI